MKNSSKKPVTSEELNQMLEQVGDLIDDAEIKLIISEELSPSLEEQLRLAHSANLQLRKALAILLTQPDDVKNLDEWHYLYETFDVNKFAVLKRLAEVEYMMAGNTLPEKEE